MILEGRLQAFGLLLWPCGHASATGTGVTPLARIHETHRIAPPHFTKCPSLTR
jgi:hypothetical protein